MRVARLIGGYDEKRTAMSPEAFKSNQKKKKITFISKEIVFLILLGKLKSKIMIHMHKILLSVGENGI